MLANKLAALDLAKMLRVDGPQLNAKLEFLVPCVRTATEAPLQPDLNKKLYRYTPCDQIRLSICGSATAPAAKK